MDADHRRAWGEAMRPPETAETGVIHALRGLRLASQLAKRDHAAVRREYYVEPSQTVRRIIQRNLRDQRDAPLVYALLNVAMYAPTSAAVLVMCPPSHVLGVAYVVLLYLLFAQRFLLAMHYAAHKPPFAPTNFLWREINALPTTTLCAFFGIPPFTYLAHHVAMHHGGGNSPRPWRDLSSTAAFPRGGARGTVAFVYYWLTRFAVGLPFTLPVWTLRRRGVAEAAKLTAGVLLYAATFLLLRTHNPVAALYLVPVPYAVSSLLLAFGNWSQHVLLDLATDGSARGEPHAVAYDCLYCADNARTFNDGYHAIHHEDPTCHWSEMPLRYAERCDAWIAHLSYVRENGTAEGAPPRPPKSRGPSTRLAFSGLGFFDVGVLCLLGERGYQQLGHHFVDANGPSLDEPSLARDAWWAASEVSRRLSACSRAP